MSEQRIRTLAEQIVKHPTFQAGLMRLVSDAAVAVMQAQAGGETFYVPKVQRAERVDRKRRVFALAAGGMSSEAIAKAVGVSRRYVNRLLAEAAAAGAAAKGNAPT